MKLRIGPVLISTFEGLQDACDEYARKHDMLNELGQVEKKWEGMFAGLVLFCRMLFGVKK